MNNDQIDAFGAMLKSAGLYIKQESTTSDNEGRK